MLDVPPREEDHHPALSSGFVFTRRKDLFKDRLERLYEYNEAIIVLICLYPFRYDLPVYTVPQPHEIFNIPVV